jgi:hypothetical protein
VGLNQACLRAWPPRRIGRWRCQIEPTLPTPVNSILSASPARRTRHRRGGVRATATHEAGIRNPLTAGSGLGRAMQERPAPGLSSQRAKQPTFGVLCTPGVYIASEHEHRTTACAAGSTRTDQHHLHTLLTSDGAPTDGDGAASSLRRRRCPPGTDRLIGRVKGCSDSIGWASRLLASAATGWRRLRRRRLVLRGRTCPTWSTLDGDRGDGRRSPAGRRRGASRWP